MDSSATVSGNASPGLRRIALPQCDHQVRPYNGPPKAEVLAMRSTYLSPALFHLYREPLMIVEGHKQYVWDETGRRYLDTYGGIVSISAGHCHPNVVKRVQEQMATLTHATTLYLHPNIAHFGKRLAEHFPPDSGLSQTTFANSGAEANEIAMLIAREHTGNYDVIALRNGYHGATTGTMGATAYGPWRFKSNIVGNPRFTTPAYCYRCPFGRSYPSCDIRCARDTEDVIRFETAGSIAAFIAEPIQGVGGVIVPPKEYFQLQYEIVRRYGGVCIADEVQTGFGRTGEHFWGYQNWGVSPDIVTMAKGIGNGFPLGAVTARPQVIAALKNKLHLLTGTGNPLAMANGLAVLETIDEEQLQQNARVVGGHLKGLLLELQQRFALIGDVRGMGLMLGVELVRDRKTREPAADETNRILELARERQLLMGKGGYFGNVLRIKPPLCVTRDDAEFAAAVLGECLASL